MKDGEVIVIDKIHGKVKEFISPSGFSFVLREQNGDDDDTISNAKGVMEGISSARFLSDIVVKTNYTSSGKLTVEDAMALKLCDKYFLILASRIFSIGQYLKFTYEWPDIEKPIEYEEDLLKYIWDYGDEKKPFPKEEDENYYGFRIKPHEHGKDRSMEITLESQKVIKFDFMNSNGELYQMNLKEDQTSKNAELKSRNLSQKIGDQWVKVESFKNFSPRDMMEIRNNVFENDPILELYTEIEHPTTGKIEYLPILGTSDFFFPREV